MKKMVKGVTILTLSTGNMKLKGDEENAFLIWNLPACSTCPFATSLCQKFCYAKKAERIYPSVSKSRNEQMEDSRNDDFVQNMVNTIKHYLAKKLIAGKIVYFRIHESGDFYSQEYFDKWVEITQQFPEVNFLAYTKSVKYVKETKQEIPSNFVIRFSVWADTKDSQKELAKELKLPIYTAFPKDELQAKVDMEGFTKCDCDCSICKNCYSSKYQKLVVAIH